MKPLILTLIMCIAMIGCGDDVTNINGYTDEQVAEMIAATDEQVAEMIAASKDTIYQVKDGDSVITYIYMTDTLYNQIIDTVFTTVIDTVYNRVIDTVITTMVDTVYNMVIDTVFTTLNNIGVDTELPRDTTITLSETNGSTITQTIYNGVVFKGVFYSAETHPAVWNYADGTYSALRFYANPCTNGFRLFNEVDAYMMHSYLNMLFDDKTIIYLSTIKRENAHVEGYYNLTLNVASYMIPSTTKYYSFTHSKQEDLPIVYVCAYDL